LIDAFGRELGPQNLGQQSIANALGVFVQAKSARKAGEQFGRCRGADRT
jgi:hypothetical protein